MKRKLMLLMTCLMIGIGLVNAQVRKVTGTVTLSLDCRRKKLKFSRL